MTRNKPNIVMILADELRADALGCYGNSICRTPNLDRLAAQGTLFEQCMVTQPILPFVVRSDFYSFSRETCQTLKFL